MKRCTPESCSCGKRYDLFHFFRNLYRGRNMSVLVVNYFRFCDFSLSLLVHDVKTIFHLR